MNFSTTDHDNDLNEDYYYSYYDSGQCAQMFGGGWLLGQQ